MGALDGKVVFVAGADNLVGRAVCDAAAVAGGRVFAVGDPGSGCGETVAPLDPLAWTAAFARCRERHGRLDVVVNARHRADVRSIADTSPSDFAAAFVDHGTVAWLIQKHAILALRDSGGGAIVVVVSALARVATSDAAALCAAARGILMASKSAALECARRRDSIVVNAVLAGRIEGDPRHWPDGRLMPSAAAVSPTDVAAAVIFYASDGAAYMTGGELPVDAGFLAR